MLAKMASEEFCMLLESVYCWHLILTADIQKEVEAGYMALSIEA